MSNLPPLQDKAGRTVRKGRISPALMTAIRLIVEGNTTLADAAERVGYKKESLEKALCKPHVKAFRADVKRAWLNGETSKAWAKVGKLRDSAQSEKVQLEASRTFIQASGELAPPPADGHGVTVQLIQFVRPPDAEAAPVQVINGVCTLVDEVDPPLYRVPSNREG